ncbi:hypothetical protein ACFQ3L_03510 [Lacticaseibacillus jixianensis]|uniref:Uncharacterized protein n=1 Tax=Lacticaseibacillus jixianensis TaxID=2486012 RepID=A0ABW4B6K1_9LACO|nr:hypothetical protein [Lacticaseibacillus jixianensis]
MEQKKPTAGNPRRIWISIAGAALMLMLAINDVRHFGWGVVTLSTFAICAYFIYEIVEAIRHPQRVADRLDKKHRWH